ncbi:hypothetical protein D9M72_33840 [compost metagenome]
MRAVSLQRAGNRLVRGVLARNVAAPATNARLLVNVRYRFIVDVQVFPVGGMPHRLPAERFDSGMPMLVHPACQAVLHVLDDTEAMQHRCRAHLHGATAQGHELGGVTPVADAANATNRQAPRFRVAGDFRHHVQGDRLHCRTAVTAMGTLVPDNRVGHHAVQVDAGDRVDGVDQRHGIGPASVRGAGRLADIGDVRRKLHDHRQRAVRLAPAGDHFHIFRHLADGRPHAALRHSVRATEVQLDAISPGGFHQRQDELPRLLYARHHQRDDQCAVGPVLLHLGNFTQVDVQ